MNNINNLFMFVKEGNTKAFKIDYNKSPEKYYDKIVFILETKEIITHGTTFCGTTIFHPVLSILPIATYFSIPS